MLGKIFKKGCFYHVFNKSISNYGIFKNEDNSQRFLETLDYYNNSNEKKKFSLAIRDKDYKYKNLILNLFEKSIIKCLSYCVMPDHYHLLIKVLQDNILSKYINDIENSFTRYFNIKYNRKGPLWQSDFRAVMINNNEQLLHISRYIHLNPTTSGLVEKPEDWQFSSYKDIISHKYLLKNVLTEFSISNSNFYKRFVENNIDYQKKLKLIKKLIF